MSQPCQPCVIDTSQCKNVDKETESIQKNIKYMFDNGYIPEIFERLETTIRSIASLSVHCELYKAFTIKIIPSFFECDFKLHTFRKEIIIVQASMIRLFLKYFGSSCIEFKSRINKFTSKVIQKYSTKKTIMLKVTQYIAFFPLCDVLSLDCDGFLWKDQFDDFVYSANHFLNRLYSYDCLFKSNVENRFKRILHFKADFNLMELQKCNLKERYEKLTSVFMFFMMGIQSMLLSEFLCFNKSDYCETTEFFKLVNVALSVTLCKHNTLKFKENRIALGSVLQKIHCTAIETLIALIKSLWKTLKPQEVLRILFQYLNLTHFNTSKINGETKSNSKQRELIYQALRSWVSETKSANSLMEFRSSLVSAIIFDIKYNKPSINVKEDNQSNNLKKRKIDEPVCNQVMNQRNQEEIIEEHDLLANKNLCIEAHTTIQTFLNNSTFKLEPLQFKFFQNTVKDLLLDVIQCQFSTEYPRPYFDGLCRMNLFKSLMVTITHPRNDMPVSEAINIFSSGTTDYDEKVKEFCSLSFTQLETLNLLIQSAQYINPEIKSLETSFTTNIGQCIEQTEDILEQQPGVSK